MPSHELTKAQIKSLNIEEKVKTQEILSGLAEIAAYTHLSIRTLRRAIKHRGLVAASAGRGGKYTTTKQNVDQWLAQVHLKNVIQRRTDRLPELKKLRIIDDKLRAVFASRET